MQGRGGGQLPPALPVTSASAAPVRWVSFPEGGGRGGAEGAGIPNSGGEEDVGGGRNSCSRPRCLPGAPPSQVTALRLRGDGCEVRRCLWSLPWALWEGVGRSLRRPAPAPPPPLRRPAPAPLPGVWLSGEEKLPKRPRGLLELLSSLRTSIPELLSLALKPACLVARGRMRYGLAPDPRVSEERGAHVWLGSLGFHRDRSSLALPRPHLSSYCISEPGKGKARLVPHHAYPPLGISRVPRKTSL